MRRLTLISTALLVLVMLAGCGGPQQYPTRDIQGIIQWGAGGSTDTISRAVAPLAEKHLGRSIVLSNMPGATGSIATQHVYDQKPDGYTLLFSAENPALYGVLDISPRSFDDFVPINVFGMSFPAVIVKADSPYQSMEQLIDDVKARPGKVTLASTGVGGVPFVVGAMLKSVDGLEFNTVPFDGDGPAMTALLGGHVDVTISVLSAVAEHARAGRVRILTVVSDKPAELAPDVPALGELRPDYNKFLPWGPFFGVWAKQGVPDAALKQLETAFSKAVADPKFEEALSTRGAVTLGLTGDEARKFVDKWQSVTAWLLADAGAAKKSPAELGISKP